MARECPKCGVEMEKKESHGVLVDKCPDCKGIWFDRSEFRKLIDKSSYDSWRREKIKEDIDPEEEVAEILEDDDDEDEYFFSSSRSRSGSSSSSSGSSGGFSGGGFGGGRSGGGGASGGW